ncbi:ATP-binding protein [Halomonas sp. TRM85114]|uniref:ATP-binding protein n=1 Tax=Halomonas jincaotanensis TaxID=2810616 RepID=UPI001BD5BBB4|nr:ATP-binding protein [Halomonas jincaotanensis]MBS9404814.1 ATP-binding protein [Halomonas jincaotanensis]
MTEARYGQGSTLMASQLSIEYWQDTIGAVTVADDILDRSAYKTRASERPISKSVSIAGIHNSTIVDPEIKTRV